MGGLRWPFEGLAIGWQILFGLALVIIVAMLAWTIVLFVRGQRTLRNPPGAPAELADRLTWVFLVPAMNEEVTIRDSVERLLSLPLRCKRILVIDDGSEDATPEILAAIDHPDLIRLRRDPPDAQKGKAAALNHAYRSLDLLDPPRESVVVTIVDADGRLGPDAPRYAAAHFADAQVGGVQSLVRIYNRASPLAWLQDVEFGVYGHLFQAGRNGWGTAGMGGNGQFNRLSSLDSIAGPERAPWHDRLTEDQDLGLRLIHAGWAGRQELRGTVDQQGLSKMRPLLRQRTRWSQGNLQAMGLWREVAHAPFPRRARFELLAYLLMPIWQGIIGLALLGAIYLAITGVAPFWGGGPTWQLLFFYVLAFGGTVLGALASRTREGPKGWLLGLLIGHIYAIYTWMIWPVLLRSTARQISQRGSWAKTEREPLEAVI